MTIQITIIIILVYIYIWYFCTSKWYISTRIWCTYHKSFMHPESLFALHRPLWRSRSPHQCSSLVNSMEMPGKSRLEDGNFLWDRWERYGKIILYIQNSIIILLSDTIIILLIINMILLSHIHFWAGVHIE